MKLSFNTWVYSSFPVWVPSYPLEIAIERIAKAGYDGIEIGAAAPHAYPAYVGKERRAELKKALAANGIIVAAMLPAPGGGPGFNVASPLSEERRNAIDQYLAVAQLCSDLGGQTPLYVAGWEIFGTSPHPALAWRPAARAEIAPRAAGL